MVDIGTHYADKHYRDAWAEFFERFGFTHLMTLSFSAAKNFNDWVRPEALLIERSDAAYRFLWRLRNKVFRRCRVGSQNSFLYHGFLERKSRSGYDTYPHYHFLIRLPRVYEDRFNRYYEDEWRKTLENDNNYRYSSNSIDLRPIYALDGASDYITKYSDSEDQIISNLDSTYFDTLR